jgi:hypothetical protein
LASSPPSGDRRRHYDPDQPGAARPRAAARWRRCLSTGSCRRVPSRRRGLGERKLEASKRALHIERAKAKVPGRVAPPAPRATELYAFFVNWDDTSFTSLKQNIGRIDVLVPEWLHLADETGPAHREQPARAGRSCSISSRIGGRISGSCRSSTTSTPTRSTGSRRASARCWPSPAARAQTIAGITAFVGQHGFKGHQRRLRGDSEGAPEPARLVHVRAEGEFQPRGWSVSESVPLDDNAFDYKALGACTDRPDPDGVRRARQRIGRRAGGVTGLVQRRCCQARRRRASGPSRRRRRNYGYDWIEGSHGHANQLSFQEAMREALESKGTRSWTPTA